MARGVDVYVDRLELADDEDSVFINRLPVNEDGELDEEDPSYSWMVEVFGSGRILIYRGGDEVYKLAFDTLVVEKL